VLVKEIYTVDTQLDYSVYDGSYMFRLRTVNLCMDGLYFFSFILYKLNRDANLKITH